MPFLLRLLLIFFLFYLIFRVVKGLVAAENPKRHDNAQVLVRDDLTGVFFEKDKAFTINLEGQTFYFSSRANRDAWLAQNRTLQ
jgi:hypothetical protein